MRNGVPDGATGNPAVVHPVDVPAWTGVDVPAWTGVDVPAWIGVSVPLEEHVFIFAVAITAFLVGPLAIRRLGQPGIVGIVLLGALVGPNALNLLDISDAIVLLGNVGLIYLLFTVGIELNLRGFSRAPENAAIFGIASFGLPFVVGTALGVWLLGLSPWASMLLAAVFASHTLLAYPIANRLGITQNRAVTAVFGGLLFTDTMALVVLAIVMGAVEGGLTLQLFVQVFGALLVLFLGVWLVVPPIARWFFQNLSDESYFEFLFALAVLFVAASLAEALEIAPILGAFVAGLALNRLVPRGGTLMNRIEFVGNALFIPFFLLYVGMLVNASVILDGWRTLYVAAFIIGTMLVTKWIAAWGVARVQGYDATERTVIFGLSVGQAAAALAITLIGYEQGLFTIHVLNAVVLMLLVTAVLSPWLTERAGQRLVVETAVEPGDEDVVDHRMLVPLSTDADRQQRLLELAFVLKDRWGAEPVHALTVVQPQWRGETETHVAEVEADLEDVVEWGSAAEVEIVPQTRVNHNVASGIVRGAIEVRADLILIGWDAARSLRQRMFGGIIDQVLEQTRLPVFVSRLGHPINTTDHVYVVFPHGIDHHEGFYESVYLIKRLATSLGAGVTGIVVQGATHQYERLFDLVEPETPAEFVEVASWQTLLSTLEERTEADDLVVALSPRAGGVGWHDELGNLPSRLVELPPRSFVMVYPRAGEPEYDAQFLKFT